MGRHWPRFRSRGAASRICPESRETEPEGLREALAWHYPFSLSSQTPSKLTATQGGAQRPRGAPAPCPSRSPSCGPSSWRRSGDSPGPAGHSPAPGHAVSPPGHGHPGAGSGELERLVSGGFSPPAGAAADPGQLSAFFNSPLGRRWRRPRVPPEFKFSVLLPAEGSAPAWSRGGGAAPGRSGRLVRDSGGHHGGGLQERPGLPVGAAARERSTALSWRRTAGPWRRSPENRCSERRCGFPKRGGAPLVRGGKGPRKKKKNYFLKK